MCKRETLILAMVVAAVVLAVVFSFPSSVHAASVYPLQGKVINDNLPEIKWEDGEPGDSALGKVSYLTSSRGNNYNIMNESDKNLNNLELNKPNAKGLVRLTINMMLLFLFK